LSEVPEHLLARSRARRAALGLGGGDAGGADAAPAAATPATTDEGAASAPVAAKAAAPVAAKVEAAPPPPYVQAALDRKKIPWWAASLFALLPVWAIVYAGTLSPADTGGPSVLELGGEIYAANCASCHGATGGGGVGPAFADGAVIETFPNRADHLLWVWAGSTGWPDTSYGATDKPKQGGMPAFSSLTPEELLAVVRYEREVLAGEEILEENGEALGPEEELLVTGADGTQGDALLVYFGEGAEGGTFTVQGDLPVVNGAEFSPAGG
jgi:mono/diheme cytochrome c family protein